MHRVLIPLAGEGHASLVEVSATARPGDGGDAEPGVRRSIARLQDVNLYAQAHLAANAAERALSGRRARRWNLLPAGGRPVHLQAEDLTAALGLSDGDSASAGLGLALAWAMGSARTPLRLACATGALKPDAEAGHTLIGPVGDLDRKIEAFAAGLELRRGAATGVNVPVFLPALTLEGGSVTQVHAAALERLVQAGASAGMSVQIHAVSTLDEALDHLAARLSAPHRLETLARAALAVVLAGALAWGVFAANPVQADFVPMAATDNRQIMTPARMRLDPVSSHARELEPCQGHNGLPAYRFADTLVFSFQARDRLGLGFLSRPAAVMISQNEPPVVLSARALGAHPPQALMGASIVFEPPARLSGDQAGINGYTDTRTLLVLTRRVRPINAARLERALMEVYASHEPGARLAGYRARIDQWSASQASHHFVVAGPDMVCRSSLEDRP